MFEINDGPVLLIPNSDDSFTVIQETSSDYSFIVLDWNSGFDSLLDKFKKLNYSIDIDSYPGLIRPKELLIVDITNKEIRRPLVVSLNHLNYLINHESILINDVIDNFDELIVNKNKSLLESLCQSNK